MILFLVYDSKSRVCLTETIVSRFFGDVTEFIFYYCRSESTTESVYKQFKDDTQSMTRSLILTPGFVLTVCRREGFGGLSPTRVFLCSVLRRLSIKLLIKRPTLECPSVVL